MTGAYKYLGHDVRNRGQFKQLLNNRRQFTSKPGQENSKRIKLKLYSINMFLLCFQLLFFIVGLMEKK